MLHITAELALVFLLTVGGYSNDGVGSAWGLSIVRKSSDAEENCVLSFVVPRDKVKSSCDVDAKLQRRINAMETRAGVYRQQVSKLAGQLERYMSSSDERLAKVEAQLTTARSEAVRSGRDREELAQLSARLAVLEKGMGQLEARADAMEELRGQGQSRESPSEGGEEILFAEIGGKDYKMSGRGSEESQGQTAAMVESLVKTEVKRASETLKDYVLEQVLLYNKVFSLMLPPEYHKDLGGFVETSAGFDFDSTVGDIGLYRTRSKIIPGDEVGRKLIQGRPVNDQDVKQDGTANDAGRLLKLKLKEMESRLTETGEKTVDQVGKQSQTETSTFANFSSTVSTSSTPKHEDLAAGNTSSMYIISEELIDTNDSFSGENPDLNATEVPITDDDGDFVIGTSKPGESREAEPGDGDQPNSSGVKGEQNIQDEHDRMRGWMRDGTDRQAEMEERLKSEIRAMLLAPLKNIVSLVEKRTAALEEQILEQGKHSQESIRKVSSRVDRLDNSAEAVELRVDSLSKGFQDALGRLDRLKELEATVQELKKNLSNSKIFLSDEAEAASKVDASALDAQAKRVKKLERLMGVYHESMGHYRNETMHEYRELKADMDAQTSQLKSKTMELQERLNSSAIQTLSKMNISLWEKLEDVRERTLNLEEDVSLQKIEKRVRERKVDSKLQKRDRDIRELRDTTSQVASSNRETRKKVDRLEKSQKQLSESLAATTATVDDLQLDVQISMGGWVKFDFDYDASRSDCFGDQYVRRINYTQARFVGVVMCKPGRYKIFLGDSKHAKFLNIGDTMGLGHDHCEFVGAHRNAKVNVKEISSGKSDSTQGYARQHWGEEPFLTFINVIRPSPGWYECGVSIP